jgi:hypothetical protein
MELSQSTSKRLKAKLKLLEASLNHSSDDHYRAFELVVSCIQEMRDEVIEHGFEDEADQIRFFREVKPRVIGLLTFHRFVLELKSKEKIAEPNQVELFTHKTLSKLRENDKKNENIIHYLNSGSTRFDKIFFVQVRNLGTYNGINSKALLDPDFSSLCDHVISNQLARSFVQAYLDKQSMQSQDDSTQLVWTDSKASLVELIYALHYSQAVNRGNASLKEICRTLEKAFNIQLGDVYRTFQDIQMRKGERAKYLSVLLESFGSALEENDSF